ncbi:M24 family metallopeptidase [Staphylospora marina]|uniref:M24 family metallopeptidase n=1 Tax=Staphylospora marina TaxID=2490858 RepID=UPI000F5BA2B1|nr:Xaa-Pro peptidase family protein [Staphylospora marina]
MQNRIDRLRRLMSGRGIEAVLISHPVNRRYLSGFTGSSGVALITASDAVLITDFRYVSQVKEQSPHMTLVEHASASLLQTVAEECRKRDVKELAFEEHHLTFAQHRALEDALGGIKLRPVGTLTEELRMIKDEAEIQIIRDAAKIADQAFEGILKELRPGMRERDVALRLEVMMREMGASSSSFDIIVASGKRSALPHGKASDKVLEKGDLVTLDFGACYRGYVSDLTRTVALGEPGEKAREIYGIVLEAQVKAVEAIRPGITGVEADAVARDYIREKGYGDYFGHGTGHGIGLEVHEGPTLSIRGDTVLVPGMIVTVEPGIYLPDFGGVRIEDDVLVTDAGYEVLTHSPKELILL